MAVPEGTWKITHGCTIRVPVCGGCRSTGGGNAPKRRFFWGSESPAGEKGAGQFRTNRTIVSPTQKVREHSMRFFAVFFALGLAACSQQAAETTAAPPAAFAGTVSAEREGAMEGVVVSAKKGIVTISVVSDAEGRFRFPAEK